MEVHSDVGVHAIKETCSSQVSRQIEMAGKGLSLKSKMLEIEMAKSWL